MASSFSLVFDAFKAKVLAEDWDGWDAEDTFADLTSILESAIPYFMFPRVSLARDDDSFTAELTSAEIQILATYMKAEWLERTIHSWENINAQYDERDFSPSSFLDKLTKLHERTLKKADKLQNIYYRSINAVPFDYGRLAGDGE